LFRNFQMKRIALSVVVIVAVVVVIAFAVITTERGQNVLLKKGARAVNGVAPAFDDGLHVFVCGSAAPIPAPGRAQACIAVITPDHFFVVDTGSGSVNNIGLERLPVDRLDGVLLNHFHSDHIVDLPTLNVISWASGHDGPLRVYGPPGVEQVVTGFNQAMGLDRLYRTRHHGEDYLPAASGVMLGTEHSPASELVLGDLRITSFAADHSPVEPAVSYRFDYKGRSIVITGDTVVTDDLRTQVATADLLLTDALSLPIVETLHEAVSAAGNRQLTKILEDIQGYHAPVSDIVELAHASDSTMVALYHLVPGPRNIVMEQVFKRGFTDDMVLTHDGMWFHLQAGSNEIDIEH